jgi:hypothetical protein
MQQSYGAAVPSVIWHQIGVESRGYHTLKGKATFGDGDMCACQSHQTVLDEAS